MQRSRNYTVALPNNGGPAVVSLELATARVDPHGQCIEAWISNFGGCNVYLFEGDVSLAEAEQRIGGHGDPAGSAYNVDCLLALSGSGPVSVVADGGLRHLTIFFEGKNESGQAQAVGLSILPV